MSEQKIIDYKRVQPHVLEMTEERKERMSAASDAVIDMIKAKTQGPLEAVVVLHMCIEALEEIHGGQFYGHIRMGRDDKPA